MNFTLKQEDLCGVVGKIKPFIRKTGSYAHSVENGLLFEARDGRITVSATHSASLSTTIPSEVTKNGQVVLDLPGLEYFTRAQFAHQTISFKVSTRTTEQFGRKTRETQCVTQAGETKMHICAIPAGMFGDTVQRLTAKEYRPAFIIDAGELARALKRASAYVSNQSYSSNEMRIESVKNNQLTLLGFDGTVLALETVACTTRGEVPRLALRPEAFKALNAALERFTPPARGVTLGIPERQETRVTFEVEPAGERWRVQHGGDTLRFVNVSTHWPDYQSLLPTRGRKLNLPGKALAKDAAKIVTLSQRQGKPAVFEWQNYQRTDRLALEIPGLPVMRPPMELNRKLLGSILKSFKGDLVTLLIPPEPTRPFRFTCADDPGLTVCMGRVVKSPPATPYTAPPVAEPEPEPEPMEAEPDAAEDAA
jgi:DNA polymerase III sliding clamp (beta) subunit (PCNA family)